MARERERENYQGHPEMGQGSSAAVVHRRLAANRGTPAALRVPARRGEVSAAASPRPCLYSNQTAEREEPESVFKDNLTLCNHSCLGFDLREGREKIITCFWVPFYNE